jgi:hypothetical protein
MTARVFNTYLEKQEDGDDLFVAGAARLVNNVDTASIEAAAGDPAVISYRSSRKKLKLLTYLRAVAAQSGIESKEDSSALSDLETQISQATKELEQAETNPKVAMIARSSRTEESFTAMLNDLDEFAAKNGLVELHDMPYEMVRSVRDRVAQGVAKHEDTVISFEDIQSALPNREAAVLVDMLRTADGKPVVITIPLSVVTQDRYDEASKSNRGDVEASMVGDARQRKQFYQDQQKDNDTQLAECKTHKTGSVELSQECTEDGVCVQTQQPTTITRQEYCGIVLPRNKNVINNWSHKVDSLIDRIQNERASAGSGKISSLDNATLMDSLLRNWDLPVARSQTDFEYWRTQRREPAWRAIRSALRSAGIRPDAIKGENLVFSVKVVGDQIEIRPVHIVNTQHSLIIVRKKEGVTRVLDAWEERGVKRLAENAGKKTASNLAAEQLNLATAAAGRGDVAQAAILLRKSLALDPVASASQLEQKWRNSLRDDSGEVARYNDNIKSLVSVVDRQQAYRSITSDPELKDNAYAYYAAIADFVKQNPKVPVDVHLQLAYAVSRLVAAQSGRKAPDAWTVLESYTRVNALPLEAQHKLEEWNTEANKDASKRTIDKEKINLLAIDTRNDEQTTSDPFWEGRVVVAALMYVDPADVIRSAVQQVKDRDPSFFETATSLRKIPTTGSAEWKQQDQITNRVLSLFEIEALEYHRTLDALIGKYHADKASQELWKTDNPDLRRVQDYLKQATDSSTTSNSALLSAKDRVEPALRLGKSLDTLARNDLGYLIDRGANQLLLRAKANSHSAMALRAFRDHNRLDARLFFEIDEYASALESLYPGTTSIATYHSKLNWDVLGKAWPSLASKIDVQDREEEVVVGADDGRHAVSIIRFYGIPAEDLHSLAEEIRKIPPEYLKGSGSPSDKILVRQVALNREAGELRKMIVEDRLMVLKALVYSGQEPAFDLLNVKEKRDPEPYSKSLPVESVTVPSLPELKMRAAKIVKENK